MGNSVEERLYSEKILILSRVEEILNSEYWVLSSLNANVVEEWDKESVDKLESEVSEADEYNASCFRPLVDNYRKVIFK